MSTARPRRAPLHGPVTERGVVLLWTTLVVFLVAGVVFVGSMGMETTSDIVRLQFATETHARQVAESGLVAALAWFRRQTLQPVTEFAPKRDLTADPPVDETDDPDVGLVRAFQIAPGIWGQFIVRKGGNHEPFEDHDGNGIYDPGEPVYDEDGDGRRTMAHGTRPLTDERGLAGTGSAWFVESEGRVFTRPRADLPLGEGPNAQLAFSRLATEFRRLNIAPPVSAALLASQGDEIKIKEGRITADETGIAYAEDTGSPDVDDKSDVLAPTKNTPIPGWAKETGKDKKGGPRISTEDIFGVDLPTLRAMADMSVGTEKPPKSRKWKKDKAPYTFPTDSLVVMKPWGGKKIKFDHKFPLRGSGVLVIEGDVEIKKKGNHDFDGIIVVLGKLKVEGPTTINGSVIVRDKVEIKGKKRDVTINYDRATVTRLVGEVSRYRRSKASFPPTPYFQDGRPNESRLGAALFGHRVLSEPQHALASDEVLQFPPR